jgi:hypothetical protein
MRGLGQKTVENRNSASAGRSRHPSALAPHSASPPVPTGSCIASVRKMAKRGEHARRNLIVQLQFALAAPNKRLERERGLNEMKPRERPSASPPNDGRVL